MCKYKAYIGNDDQMISCMRGALTEGSAKGAGFIDIENGAGLTAKILEDRGLDLYQVRYLGKNMNYIAPEGIRSSTYYEASGDLFMRNFFVGQLTTVGLQNVGPGRMVYGQSQGLHGRISNIPAENVTIRRTVEKGEPVLEVEGDIKEARIFGENLLLHRKYRFLYSENRILLEDVIKNCGFEPRQIALLYHINFGYPLLDENTEISINSKKVIPRTEIASAHINTWSQVESPSVPYPERCYFHNVETDSDGLCKYQIRNPKLGIGVTVQYEGEKLPYFCEWKMMGKGEYVLGMEPSNIEMDGPAPGQEGCMAPTLDAGEEIRYQLELKYEEI